MEDDLPAKGSYARRRTETKRDERREVVRLNRLEANERAAIEQTLKACERFHESRGLSKVPISNDFRKVVVSVVNIRKKDEDVPKWERKAQPEPIAKSMKAAMMREVVMAARRAGLIRDGYKGDEGMTMVEWEEGYE